MPPVIEVKNLHVQYGRADAVHGVSLEVQAGSCHALFGRNGAGKTSTLRALVGLLAPSRGEVRLFGLDPRKNEVEVKSRMAWVSDAPGFHPWMTVEESLRWSQSLRLKWNTELETQLVQRFSLDLAQKTGALSKGQRMQLALACALSADPELLVLDEPTTGLDPLVRRQFIEAIIGVFQERDPQRKTLLVSTHLITEFEGVADGFTVMSQGRVVLSSNADDARARYCRLRGWFDQEAPESVPMKTVKPPRRDGRCLEVVVDDGAPDVQRWLTSQGATRVDTESLSLEDIFLLAA